ncbi:MAG TPA: hypothetical protein VJU78_08760 [Chitinophagaceae bacterium]|nr:hypothetical protein [Chitinophagaceae bacterium]
MNFLKLYSFSLSFIFCCAIYFGKKRPLLNASDHFRSFQLTNLPDKSLRFNQQLILATSKYDNSLHRAVVSFNSTSLMLSSPTTTDGMARSPGRIVSFHRLMI